MSQNQTLILEVTQGEDYAAQIYWTDEDGAPVNVTTPARIDVRDQESVLVLQFASENAGSAATKAALSLTGSQGLIQISAPKEITRGLDAGQYRFDLFVTNNGDVSPFSNQQVRVLTGRVDVAARITIMEASVA